MNFSLKPHPLVAHWVPGFVVIATVFSSQYHYSWTEMSGASSQSAGGAAMCVLVLSVVSFVVGQILDAVRDLAEEALDNLDPVQWDFFVKATKEHLENMGEYYFTWYVCCFNMALAVASLFACKFLGWLTIPEFLAKHGYALNALVGSIILVFLADAWLLRKGIAKLTRELTKATETLDILPHVHACVRIRPSQINGVGVAAIKSIKKRAYIFPDDDSEIFWIERSRVEQLPEETRKLYEDFCIVKDRGELYGCPRSFNNLTVSWYINESKEPNVGCDKNYDFYALRDINPGEELTVDYDTYNDFAPKKNPTT